MSKNESDIKEDNRDDIKTIIERIESCIDHNIELTENNNISTCEQIMEKFGMLRSKNPDKTTTIDDLSRHGYVKINENDYTMKVSLKVILDKLCFLAELQKRTELLIRQEINRYE